MLRFTQRRRAMLLAAATAAAVCSIVIGAGAAGPAASPATVTMGTTGDGVLDFVYDPSNGDLSLQFDGDPRIGAANPLQVIRMSSATGLFYPGAFNMTAFGSGGTTNSFALNGTASGLNAVPDQYDFGYVLAPGLSLQTLLQDLTLKWNTYGGGAFRMKDGDLILGNQPALPPGLVVTYTGGSGDWSTIGNWSPRIVPRPGDSAVLSPSGGSAIVTLDGSAHATGLANLTLNATGGASVTLVQHAGGGAVATEALKIGDTGSGSYAQDGGDVSAYEASVGYGTNSVGTYELGGSGSLEVRTDEFIGYFGNGTFHQTGGVHTVSGYLSLGAKSGSVGTLDIEGGTANPWTVIVGGNLAGPGGMGTLIVGGNGTLNTSRIIMRAGHGELIVAGGTVNTAAMTISDWSLVRIGAGSFNLVGGGQTAGGSLVIGVDDGAGAGRIATVNQTGGSSGADGIVIGEAQDTVATFALSGTASMSVNGIVQVPHGNGSLLLSGGTLTASSLDLGGDPSRLHWTAGSLVLTGMNSLTLDSSAPHWLFGSVISLPTGKGLGLPAADLTIGSASGTGAVSLDGGSLTVKSLGGDLSRFHWTAGSLNITGGVNIGAGGPFGAAVVLPAGKAFTLAGNSSVSAGSSLGVTGGSLTAQTLVNDGSFVVTAGTASAGALAGGGNTTIASPAGAATAAGTARPAVAATPVTLSVGNFAQSGVTIGDGGTLAVQPAAAVAFNSAGTLQIAPSGLLDLGNQPLLLDRSATPPAVVQQYLRNAYRVDAQSGIGDWMGRGGITSSDAIAAHQPGSGSFKVSVGSIDGAVATTLGTIPGQGGLSTAKLLVRPTLYGDLNLDGKVDDLDLQILSGLGQYGKASAAYGWLGGDLNYDGKVDDRDLQILSGAGNYNGPGYGEAAGGAAMPAPSAAAVATLTGVGASGDGELDLEYDPATGDLKLRVDGDARVTAASPVQVVRLTSAGGHFVKENFESGAFGGWVTADGSTLDGTIVGAGGLADGYDLGRVLPARWTAQQVAADVGFGWNVYGGGMGLKSGDVTMAELAVPEPGGELAGASVGIAILWRRLAFKRNRHRA